MEDLIFKCNSGDGTELTVKLLKIRKQAVISFDTRFDERTIIELSPSQTRELIAHLTNCLKEVENG